MTKDKKTTEDKKTIDDGEAMNEIRKILEKREKTIQEQEKIKTQQREQDQNKEITKKDLQDLIGLMTNQQPTQTTQPDLSTPQQKQQQQPLTKQQIAAVAMKDAKNITLLSLLLLTIPTILIFITMMHLESIAIIITFIVAIYPVLLLMKSMSTQFYLADKYGFKPLFRFKTQQQPRQIPQQQPQNKEIIL